MNKADKKAIENFYKAVMSFDSTDDCKDFFDDIFTIQEMNAIVQRFEVACHLADGKSYAEVNKLTGASTATICRVAKCINYGNGGYKKVIDKLYGENRDV